MRFLLADSFTGALARLRSQDSKAVKTTVVDLQIDPTGKGLSYHRIGQSNDPNFWCVRVSRDLRLIVHKTEDSLLVAYVDHHDKAYAWAERRRIEAHPSTGAIQIVEVRERVEETAAAVPVAPAITAAGAGDRHPFASQATERRAREVACLPTGASLGGTQPRFLNKLRPAGVMVLSAVCPIRASRNLASGRRASLCPVRDQRGERVATKNAGLPCLVPAGRAAA